KSLGFLNTKVQENVSGMTTVKALSQEDYEISRFAENNADYRSKNLRAASLMSKFFPVMEFIGDFTVVFLLGLGGYLVNQGSLSLGALMAFFSLVWYIMDPLINLGFIINAYTEAKASGERLLEILNEKEEIQNLKGAK